MGLDVYLGPKHRRQLLLLTRPFFTQEMFIFEVFSKKKVILEIVLSSISLTYMTPEMIRTQVGVQNIVIKVTIVAEFTKWVPPVRSVVSISFAPMFSEQ